MVGGEVACISKADETDSEIGGVKGRFITWMKGFLHKNRAQIIKRNTNWRRLFSGVLQGSVLAPIMLIIVVYY